MKKFFSIFFCGLMFCNIGFADSYYFNECKLSEELSGNYLIDLDNNEIKVSFLGKDGSIQKLDDKIKKVTKDQIISEVIQNRKNKKYYLQYYLDAKSKSVIRQRYKKKHQNDFMLPDGPKKQAYCVKVKADWNEDIQKEESEIQKTREQSVQIESSVPKCQGNNIQQWTDCQGTRTNENGYKYSGQFKDGKILKGTAIYSGGAKYFGEFKDDKPHGQGTFTYSDGSKYYGEWKNGKSHGTGIKTWKNGKKYAGNFKDDKPHGQGTFTYPDGSKYVGEHKDGKRHGQGTLTYSNGKTYIGRFVAGYEHGDGTCFNKDGSNVACKMDISSTGKNTHDISINGKKWIKLSEYNSSSAKQLEIDFDIRASELCATTGNFGILEKRIEVIEMDETPTFGIETVIKIGVNGVIECK